ncbi:MAG: diaminopimelate decarboxylase, partial [Gemmatimonadota bacterium]|nr:diaminopimelate decarboxylase [Gemmatimonadota bacterium]
HVDVGGGLGIPYAPADVAPGPREYAQVLSSFMQGRELGLVVEPGRAIVGQAGLLLCRVEYLKHTAHKNFALVDAAMNDFLRPSLYSAWHEISPVCEEDGDEVLYDVVGPVCESSDWFGSQRSLRIRQGSLLAVHDAGAYGFVMASNYNSRMRPAEILVDGDQAWLIRKRESVEQLFADEMIPG